MAKSFRILLEVEEAALGHVMNLLHRTPGVLRFDPLLDPSKTAKAANGEDKKKKSDKPRYTGDDTAEQLILKHLAKRGATKSTAFPDVFEKAGRARSSPTFALHKAKKDGLIQIGQDGYTLTKKGRDRARYV